MACKCTTSWSFWNNIVVLWSYVYRTGSVPVRFGSGSTVLIRIPNTSCGLSLQEPHSSGQEEEESVVETDEASGPDTIETAQAVVADPGLLTWMRENDVREGSSLVVQGRLTIKNYLNRRGAWAPSYSITAEKLALAVNVGFVVDRVVEGERPVNRNATVESTRQRLFADKVLRQDFSDEFIAEIRQGQTAAHDQVFVRQFQEHFPRSALGLENSAVLALAESFSSSHRKMLLFGEPARMTPQVLRTVLVNSPVLFEQGHLTQTMLIAFLDAMFFSIAQSASESTSASTATDDVVMRTA